MVLEKVLVRLVGLVGLVGLLVLLAAAVYAVESYPDDGSCQIVYCLVAILGGMLAWVITNSALDDDTRSVRRVPGDYIPWTLAGIKSCVALAVGVLLLYVTCRFYQDTWFLALGRDWGTKPWWETTELVLSSGWWLPAFCAVAGSANLLRLVGLVGYQVETTAPAQAEQEEPVRQLISKEDVRDILMAVPGLTVTGWLFTTAFPFLNDSPGAASEAHMLLVWRVWLACLLCYLLGWVAVRLGRRSSRTAVVVRLHHA